MMKPFNQTECNIGGCLCAAHDDWLQRLREIAKAHPLFPGREGAAETDDDKIEAIDELAEELADGQHGEPPTLQVDLSLCMRPDTCRWSAS